MKKIVSKRAFFGFILSFLTICSSVRLESEGCGSLFKNIFFKTASSISKFVYTNPKKIASIIGVAGVGIAAVNTVDALPDDSYDKKEVTIVSHGFFSTRHRHVFGYGKNIGFNFPFLRSIKKNKRYITNGRIKTFSYGDVFFGCLPFGLHKTSLGQYHDVKTLTNKCNDELENKVKEINLHGISRGASTVANFILLNNDNFNNKKNNLKIKSETFTYENLEQARGKIKTAVLESPFDKAFQVFANHGLIKALSIIPYLNPKRIYNITQKISLYKDNGMQPIDSAKNMDENSKKIKTLIVLSLEDTLVTPDSSLRLAIKMKEKNPNNTYVLILDKGKHGNLLNGPDGTKYCNVMHSFYKNCDVRYDYNYAEAGEEDFKKCKISVKELKKTLAKLEEAKKFEIKKQFKL